MALSAMNGVCTGVSSAGTALLVEGAIDALSAWILADRTQIDIVISTAGAIGNMPNWINGLQLETIFCGYDADHVGDHAARMLETQNPKLRRMRPDSDGDVKDWNEVLKRQKNIHKPDLEKNR